MYHAPLSFTPTFGPVHDSPVDVEGLLDGQTQGDAVEIVKDKVSEGVDEACRVTEEDMKVFVNSERWSLGQSNLSRVKQYTDDRFGEYEQPSITVPPLRSVCITSTYASCRAR